MGRAKPTELRNQLRRLRFEASEMTQAALAQQVGVSRQTLIAIEQSKYSPSLEVAFKLARIFGVGVEEVFQYNPQEEEIQ